MCIALQDPAYEEQVELLEGVGLQLPQIDCPLTHQFAPGCYLREIKMPAGTFVIGHKHKTSHFNVITKGKVRLMMDGKVAELEAPHIFTSEIGVRKILLIIEDCTWLTIHPIEGTDIDDLESRLFTKSATFLEHEQHELEALQQSVKLEEVCQQ